MIRRGVLFLGCGGEPRPGREFEQVASEQNGWLAIAGWTPASAGGRRRWHGWLPAASAPARSLAGPARSVEPSPGAEAGAQ